MTSFLVFDRFRPMFFFESRIQLFITFRDLKHLGTPKTPWEVPFGVVTHGMDTVIDKLYQGYGDQYDFNPGGVNQGKLMRVGNGYLK